MSGRQQIHVFFGAPIIPTQLEVYEKKCSSITAAEPWKELHLSYCGHALCFSSEKVKETGHVELQATNSVDLTHHIKNQFSLNSGQRRFEVAEDCMTSCVSVIGSMDILDSAPTRTGDLAYSDYQKSKDREIYKNQVAYQQLPQIFTKTEKRHRKQSKDCFSNYAESDTRHMRDNCCDISDLFSSAKQISMHLKSVGQEDVTSELNSVNHEHLSQYLEMCFPMKLESKPKIVKNDCFNLAVSTDTEFLSILTSSQVAIFAQKTFKKQAAQLSGLETGTMCVERKAALSQTFKLNHNAGKCISVTETEYRQESSKSRGLFSSEGARKTSCFESTKNPDSCENTKRSPQLFTVPEQLLNEIHIEPLSTGLLCSQVNYSHKFSSKRARTFEDTPSICNSVPKTENSKRAKLSCSSASPGIIADREKVSEFVKLQNNPLLLKNCCCKSQKYVVLVAVIHPCHVKEILIKSRSRSSSKIPIATIVVIDQSEVERKIVLWRAAAFWSLTVFPGDIVLLTDVTVYENLWFGEMMLQSTFASRLLNLGSCSAINPKEFSHVVDVGVLQDLLAYVSSKFTYLRDLPRMHLQKWDNIQHVQLDQLQQDTLIHSVLKIVSISILTAVYSYKGEKQRKVILTVEQIRDQPYIMVLWGAGAAWYPQLRKKKDHLWEFKNLLVQCSSISGTFELHTTPWSSCECLFDDDKRAITFKEKFQKSEKSLMKMTDLSTHIMEKRSGLFQVKTQILELKFVIATDQFRQLILDSDTSLECILASLPLLTYSGCAKCGLELQTDKNKIYKQCLRCLPLNEVKTFYRSALMTVEHGECDICIHVVSELMEKIFLNVPADWLNRLIGPSSDTTYAMIVADLCHSLLADTKASYLLEIRSHFVLDENSYPLQQDFHLLDFHPEIWSTDLCS
ncbi:PREDICTED: protein FAM35A isoform X2 [Gavialis gangeticus]|uniref:protein FAM35A isoform X2 n=1 Tax=Gavialis gangeticus TaxID=94835 RepID=UPI00092F37C2|nr:PREDICTED: protein FAM35A isoform X2 [Gavialis gangeticus]